MYNSRQKKRKQNVLPANLRGVCLGFFWLSSKKNHPYEPKLKKEYAYTEKHLRGCFVLLPAAFPLKIQPVLYLTLVVLLIYKKLPSSLPALLASEPIDHVAACFSASGQVNVCTANQLQEPRD
jgi:hypothetical protein